MYLVSKYINPFTDFGFKKIFGDRDNTDLLKSLINDILDLKGNKRIKKLKFRNTELLPDSPEDRKAIYDLYCKDEDGDVFIVELQKVYQEHFQSRALYYTTFPIQEQATRGSWDFHLTPIYFIGLLNFQVDKFLNSSDYIHHGQIMDIKRKEVMYEGLNMVYVEIPKFKKKNQKSYNHLEWWLYVFQNLHRLTDIPKELKGDIIERAFDKAEFIKMPKPEQEKYHKNLKVYRDLINSYNTASKVGYKRGIKRGIKQGIKKGIEQGIEKGIEQGIEKGIERGKEEGEKQAKIEIAKSLLDVLDIETISMKTGLSVEEIEKLKSK
jgi:predicted transposase/invertase (TIGR01784 family)